MGEQPPNLSEERAARNEALFRQVNEEVEQLHVESDERGEVEFICECGDDRCTQRLTIKLPEYEQVRRHARRFIVIPGHELPEVEHVVARGDGYLVVEKDSPTAARVAEQTDPRK